MNVLDEVDNLRRADAELNRLLMGIRRTAVGEANTASNQGAGGVGLFDAKVGVDLQFRKINAGSNKVTVTLDAGNKEVDIDIAEAQIDHENLSGLLGGAVGDHYHLKAVEWGYVSGVFAQSVLKTASPMFASFGLIDTGADHELYLKCNEDLSADRILNLIVGDAARTIILSGDPTLGNWFDQSVKQAASPYFAKVGIGMTPTHELDVYGNAPIIRAKDDAGSPAEAFIQGTAVDAFIGELSGNHPLRFWVGGAARLTITTAGIIDFGILMPSTDSRMAAYAGSEHTVADSSWEIVEIDTEDFDTGSDFNTGTYLYTAPVSGYYLIMGQIAYKSPTADKVYYCGIQVNGVLQASGLAHAASGSVIHVSSVSIQYVPAGQTIGLWAYQNSGFVKTIDDGGWRTYLHIHLLSNV